MSLYFFSGWVSIEFPIYNFLLISSMDLFDLTLFPFSGDFSSEWLFYDNEFLTLRNFFYKILLAKPLFSSKMKLNKKLLFKFHIKILMCSDFPAIKERFKQVDKLSSIFFSLTNLVSWFNLMKQVCGVFPIFIAIHKFFQWDRKFRINLKSPKIEFNYL